MRTIFVLFSFLILAAGFFLFPSFGQEFPSLSAPSKDFVVQEIEKFISAPPPLRGPETPPQAASVLTKQGVLQWTNVHRFQSGLVSLLSNARLDVAASKKLQDMFARQYFAHVAPTGEGAGDLAKDAGYEFISIGENLALGNYQDDKALAQAWMDSPGHRANILKGSHREIGIAVGKGIFEEKELWLAVQIFGAPSSLCPRPDVPLQTQIEDAQLEIGGIENELSQMREEIENTRPKRGQEYNAKVDEYNALVNQYNTLVQGAKTLVETYNTQVRVFNNCVASLSS
ncbi:MAG: hypothetical protein HYS52_02255 [Candidatus Wildermuthbacteria bacterium]|nr:hypothetical protein [Candidatus Wildermuthbacteria bacterium]